MRKLRGVYLIIPNNPVVQGRSETEIGPLASEAGARGSKPISATALNFSLFNFNPWEFKFPFIFRTLNLELMFKHVHAQVSKHMEYMSISAY